MQCLCCVPPCLPLAGSCRPSQSLRQKEPASTSQRTRTTPRSSTPCGRSTPSSRSPTLPGSGDQGPSGMMHTASCFARTPPSLMSTCRCVWLSVCTTCCYSTVLNCSGQHLLQCARQWQPAALVCSGRLLNYSSAHRVVSFLSTAPKWILCCGGGPCLRRASSMHTSLGWHIGEWRPSTTSQVTLGMGSTRTSPQDSPYIAKPCADSGQCVQHAEVQFCTKSLQHRTVRFSAPQYSKVLWGYRNSAHAQMPSASFMTLVSRL